jgi:predicted deoxyguanosinetriphosphate triphosphohydrolase
VKINYITTIINNKYEEKSNIEAAKAFQRLKNKTQVYFPQSEQEEVTKTRFSHVYEVATCGMIMANIIGDKLDLHYQDIDHKDALENVCLAHDIGHPPFGHDGANMISDFFINLGLSEGFDDNNNNMTIIEKDKFNITDHVKVSLIKYPHKLYKNQEFYLPLLQKEIEADALHFSKFGINLKNQKRTITCQIMDEADRNSYVTSDLSDFLCIGGILSLEHFELMESYSNLSDNIKDMILELVNATHNKSKTEIKNYFNYLKNQFCFAFTINENGLVIDDQERFNFREFLSEVELEYLIKPIRKEKLHKDNMAMLEEYLNYVIDNEYYPSNTYKSLIKNSTNKLEKLRHIRDMVSEVSDWYIITFYKKLNAGELD